MFGVSGIGSLSLTSSDCLATGEKASGQFPLRLGAGIREQSALAAKEVDWKSIFLRSPIESVDRLWMIATELTK